MHYDKVKRDKIDFCNICGKYENLTWDHVPPKCCNNMYPIKVNSWWEGIPEDTNYEKNYQNGIRYRSLCSECNSKLGAKYDIVLDKFTKDLTRIIESSIVLPSIIKIPVEINKLCKAICGHILAAKNFYDKENLIDLKLREYVLRENSCPPKEMSLLYWIYLYSAVVILRDVSVTPNGMKYKFPKGVISIVNSFPAAYIISTDKETCGLCDLFDMCSENIDEIVEIVIDLNSCYFAGSKHYRPMLWPCNVDSNEDGAVFLLGYDKVMEASKLAVHSEDSIKKIRARLASGKR